MSRPQLTPEFVAASTGASLDTARRYAPHLRDACVAYDISTPRRVAGFLSQIGHESNALGTLEENLKYTVGSLITLFGRHRISEADARRLGRNGRQAPNPEAIANLIYGGDFGRTNLGNTQPGDGWRFRGRGLKQLTGRTNYHRCGLAIGRDLVDQPDLLLQPEHAALSAGWFWAENGCNALADAGDVTALTRKINGGTIGLSQRAALYTQAMAVFA